jgi:hypothetical protein
MTEQTIQIVIGALAVPVVIGSTGVVVILLIKLSRKVLGE